MMIEDSNKDVDAATVVGIGGTAYLDYAAAVFDIGNAGDHEDLVISCACCWGHSFEVW